MTSGPWHVERATRHLDRGETRAILPGGAEPQYMVYAGGVLVAIVFDGDDAQVIAETPHQLTGDPLNRAEWIAECEMRAHAFRNMQFVAEHGEEDPKDRQRYLILPDPARAAQHRIRAETYEALANDLRAEPCVVVRR